MFFNRGEIGISVPLAYPLLLYLLGPDAVARVSRWEPALRPSLAGRWLALAAVVLIAFRVTLNVADSG